MFVDVAWAMGQSGGGVGGQQGLAGFLPLIVIFAIFYFLLIRPQQQKQKKHKAMIHNLKKGDRVITLGGLYGTISGIESEVFLLKIANNVEVRVRKQGVSYLQGDVIEDD